MKRFSIKDIAPFPPNLVQLVVFFFKLKSSQLGPVEKFTNIEQQWDCCAKPPPTPPPPHSAPQAEATVLACNEVLNGESSLWPRNNTSKQPSRNISAASLGATSLQGSRGGRGVKWGESKGRQPPRSWAPAAFGDANFSWTTRPGHFIIKDKSTNKDLPSWGCPSLLPLSSWKPWMGTPQSSPSQASAPYFKALSCPGPATHTIIEDHFQTRAFRQ